MRLPENWEHFLAADLDINRFYSGLDRFLEQQRPVLPDPSLIFHVFKRVTPNRVTCVLFGEDPYPRAASANGIAFWDGEIKSWQDKTNGNSLKNMLKALLVARGWAAYETPIARCREIARDKNLPRPDALFEQWLRQGVFLLNTSLTFSGPAAKKAHFDFWRPFHETVIHALNRREGSAPFYILWGKKAQRWQPVIGETIDRPEKMIVQGHPTFIHQFLKKGEPSYSPFTEIETRTGMKWI